MGTYDNAVSLRTGHHMPRSLCRRGYADCAGGFGFIEGRKTGG